MDDRPRQRPCRRPRLPLNSSVTHERCRLCAEACRSCERACGELLLSLG
ncbi:four-helix bundle copper-binding protein [Streptomyces hebeiensis]